jgi:hypothetical protein
VLELFRGSHESSTVANFAVQLVVLEGSRDVVTGASAEQVSQWARLVVAVLDRPALDQTGIAGRFDVVLRWTPDNFHAANKPGDSPEDLSTPPGLFTAMKEQQGEQQGCVSVNSIQKFAILPDEAYGVVTENRALLQRLLAMNIELEEPKMAPSAIAELVLSFFSGLCIERNLKSGKVSSARKAENFMTALRSL